jgi:hypothetical protein
MSRRWHSAAKPAPVVGREYSSRPITFSPAAGNATVNREIRADFEFSPARNRVSNTIFLAPLFILHLLAWPAFIHCQKIFQTFHIYISRTV